MQLIPGKAFGGALNTLDFWVAGSYTSFASVGMSSKAYSCSLSGVPLSQLLIGKKVCPCPSHFGTAALFQSNKEPARSLLLCEPD